MEPTPNQEFHISDLLACVAREVAMRKSCYPKWDKVTSLDALSPARKKELAMMQAVGFTLTAQSELIGRLTATPAPLADAELGDYTTRPGGGGLGDVATFSAVAKAISCLYIQLPEQVADDVNEKFNAFIKAVVAERAGLLARLAAAEAPKWVTPAPALSQPSNLPKQDEKVLLILKSGNFAVGQLTWAYRWLLQGGAVLLLQDVIHWQPLPAAPAETVKGGQPNA